MEREILARFVHRKIFELAKGAGWTTAPRIDDEDALPEGDYTDVIDTALRYYGYIDEDGFPDITLALETDFDTIADYIEELALQRLQVYYATVVDTVGGPVRIYRSQVSKALAARTSASARRIQTGGISTRLMESLLFDD